MTAKVIAFTKPISPEYGNNISLKYLQDHKHFSPFEMADIVIEIETTRDIARQLLRHRSFYFQEFSQRYAIVNNFSEPKEARLQDLKNRQNSLFFDNDKIKDVWEFEQKSILDHITSVYNWAIENGIAKEVARVILPEGLTRSRLYMKGSIRSWIHYLEVRLDPSTQKEHRELAQEISDAIESVLHG